MKKIINFLLIMLLVVSGCKKEEDVLVTTNTSTFIPTVMTNVKGIVLDENQNPISGVTVNIGSSNSTSSTDNGLFTFNNISVSENRAMIYFEKMLEKDANSWTGWNGLANCYRFMFR